MDDVPARLAERTRPAARGAAATDALAARLAETGERVAVLVPARDEEATVGAVVRALATLGPDARGERAVVHEFLVIDGASEDATADEARAAGARVLAQTTADGKGAALTLGLAATEAELVVTVDADLVAPDADTVVALVTALVDDPTLTLVKAAYDRPLTLDGAVRPSGGGRVTELLARPVLALAWPELAWLAQPLAGEWAVRRALVADLDLEPGYGVELGLILDVARTLGVDALAQVDLGARAHRHQDLAALGRMATEVLAVAFDRLVREGRAAPSVFAPPHGPTSLWQPVREADGRLTTSAHPIRRPRAPR